MEKRNINLVSGFIKWSTILIVFVVAVLLSSKLLLLDDEDSFQFGPVETDKERFIAYSDSIELSVGQQKLRKEVFSSVPSPCCELHTADNCCGCDTAKSILGLSNYLIVHENYDSARVREIITKWIELARFGTACCDGSGAPGCCEKEKASGCEVKKLEEVVGSCRIPGL